jgi:cobalt-zinc-cadmium efflux system membrane fusion protein
MKEAGIEVEEAMGGSLDDTLALPGEVVLNSDTVAHIVPRVAGIVRRVDKSLGDDVLPGQVMAVLDSRELADVSATFLAASHRLTLAQARSVSNEKLNAAGIVPNLEFLSIQRELATVEIEKRTAEYKLHAFGMSQRDVEKLNDENDVSFSTYELRAPFSGTVIARHLTLGEVADNQQQCFILADLTNVWVNVTVFPKDIPRVKKGLKVEIRGDAISSPANGEITYLAAVVDETTRTAMARVVLPNPDRRWRPGEFVTVSVMLPTAVFHVLVPNEAAQRFNNKNVVFIESDGAFEERPIVLGRKGATHSEILSGLKAGERLVVHGAFILKSELMKGESGHAD